MNSICVGLKLGSFDGSKLNNLYRATINLNLPEGSDDSLPWGQLL